jgi:apolipoprotein N-acyltransferase
MRAAVLQGNYNSDVELGGIYGEQVWQAYRSMTLEAGLRGAKLIVWPEAAVTGSLGGDQYTQSRVRDLAEDADALLLVGGRDEDGQGRVYNSAFLIGPKEGILSRYAKVHLVPFGEYVLWRRQLPFLRYYRVTEYDLSPGKGYNLLRGGGLKVGTAICFESIFPDILRRMTASGAEVLCVITNDSWFGKTAAAEQHMSMSVFRAVENRRYLLRAASTGVSCIINPRGRILVRSGIFRRASLESEIKTCSIETFYTRHGNWFVFACFALVSLFALNAITRRGIGLARRP